MCLKGEVTCPCCGFKTLASKGNYEICTICFWEDDPFQRSEIHDTGANQVSLVEAQENFKEFGACEREMLQNVRRPNAQDERGEDWNDLSFGE